MSLSRREFLRASAAGAVLAAAQPNCSAPRPQRRVLVLLSLRGGLDGLTLCVPHGDAELYRARPTLAIAPPGRANGAIDLDGRFGLAPSAAPLLAPFREGRLAFVHGVGPSHATRSHFVAVRIADQGATDVSINEPRAGWLARLLEVVPSPRECALRAVAIERLLPPSLAGSPEALALPDVRLPRVCGGRPAAIARLRALYDTTPGDTRALAARTFAVLERLEKLHLDVRDPPRGEPYPPGELGVKLARAAAWIRADQGLEVVTLESGGWDHHGSLGPTDGVIAERLDVLSRALAAFDRDLGPWRERVTLVAHSEFGRRVAENASAGLDHGHGGVCLLLGAGIAGGRVHAEGFSLAPAQLDDGDVRIVHDTRSVLAELVARDVGTAGLARVFPHFTPRFAGVLG